MFASNFLLKNVKSWFCSEPAAFEERRSIERQRISFEAEIETPEGRVPVRGVDLHRQGAMVLSKGPLTPGSVVFLQLKSCDFGGFGEIRHCTLRKGRYSLGLQFRGPLSPQAGQWRTELVHTNATAWTAEDDFAHAA